MVHIGSYARAASELQHGRVKGRKKIDNHTYLEQRDSNTIALKLHDTDIVTYHEDGTVVLDTGGWKTVTTRDRMQSGLPEGFSLTQDKGQWYIVMSEQPWSDTDAPRWLFVDGMTIKEGEVFGGIKADKEVVKAQQKERRQAKKFAGDFINALKAGDIDAPGPGDCWACLLKTESGQHALENDAPEHMREHMKEGYFVPTLLEDAVKRFGTSILARDVLTAHWISKDPNHPQYGQAKKILEYKDDFSYRQLEKVLYRYILEKLGQAS